MTHMTQIQMRKPLEPREMRMEGVYSIEPEQVDLVSGFTQFILDL